MKVYANDIGNCDYITKLKEYDLRHYFEGTEKGSFAGWITDDNGRSIFVYTHNSSHIGGNEWSVVND